MIRRNIEESVLRALADTPVVMLNGARQTGKTTLAQAIVEKIGGQYFTFDDAVTAAMAAADPAGFVRNLSGPVVLDEFQKVPDLLPAIKLAVDKDRTPGRFLLTGSANIFTLPRLSESLAGRMEIIPLFPLSVGEIEGRRETFVNRLFDGQIGETKSFSAEKNLSFRLVQGGFPETLQRKAENRRSAWFGSYLSAILQRDVRDLARVEALHAMPNLLKLLAARVSGLLNLSDVSRDAGLSYTTLARYMVLLETLFLVYRLPAWSPNLGKRLVKMPKIHLVDTGLTCNLLGIDARRLEEDRTTLGKILETFVVSELRKQISWTDPPTAIYHYRTATGSEVDVILERANGSIAAIEVKAGMAVGPSDFAALRDLREQLNRRFQCGVLLYLGDQILPYSEKLWLMPLSILWAE